MEGHGQGQRDIKPDAPPVTDPPAPESDLAVFDIEQALLVTGGDVDILRRVTDMFVETLPARLGQFEAAFSTSDQTEMKRLAHATKGAAASVGAPRLTEAAFDLELSARDGSPAEWQPCFEVLKRELGVFRDTLMAFDWSRYE